MLNSFLYFLFQFVDEFYDFCQENWVIYLIISIFIVNRLIKIKEWVDKNDPGAVLIPFSGVFENKVLDMDETERKIYFEESKVTR